MPVTATITENLSNGYHVAVGTYKAVSRATCGPVEMLLKETPEGLKPVLDSKIRVSKIMNKEVEMYVNAPVVDVFPVVGAELDLKNFHFKLKAS